MVALDQQPELAALAARWADIQARRDEESLAGLFVADPSMVVFAPNGHSYRGAAHLRRALSAASAPDPAGAEPALAVAGRRGSVAWIALADGEAAPQPVRSTLIVVEERDAWRIAHLHASPVSDLARPGAI